MLQVNKGASHWTDNSSRLQMSVVDGVRTAIRIVRRQLPLVSIILLCSIVLPLIYILVTPPKFTAVGELVIDTRKNQVLQQQSVLSEPEIDSSTVQTQVGIITSKNISLAVIRKLHLDQDSEFTTPGFLDGLLAFVRGQGADRAEAESQERVLTYFDTHRSVKRQGLTYIIQVGFTSLDPKKSAAVVNAIMNSYVEDQLASKYEAARRAGDWLLERITKLREQALESDRALVEFKEKNNIVDTGVIPGTSQGRLLTEQQLSEVNSQLMLAAAATAEARARYERMQQVMSHDVLPDPSFTESLKNEVIIGLRKQFLILAQREAEVSQKYGANHTVAVNLRAQMQEVRRSIADEMSKIEESYKNDYEIALTREASLRKSLGNLVGESLASKQAQIELHELKSKADLSRAIYENFLKRYMEASQQKDAVPISESRTISPASPPSKRSQPNVSMTLALSLVGGSLISFLAAYLREASNGDFRTIGQVEYALHLKCLAEVPVLKDARPNLASSTYTGTYKEGQSAGSDTQRRGPHFLRHVLEAPFSRYTEAIKAIKIAADLNDALNSNKVIGVTSSLSGEGKSTIASNLAHLIADAGATVILVDADLRGPSLTQRLAPNCVGLVEVISGNVALETAITPLPFSTLHFLGAGRDTKLPHTNEILASVSMKNLFETLRNRYDHVIVDLSPVGPIVDVRATAHIIDSYVYVIEWGKTRIDVINRSLADASGVYDRLLGVVLNKVNLKTLDLYENYSSRYFYSVGGRKLTEGD